MTKNVLLDCFVQNLEKERLNLGMTQAEFASKLEISVSTYKISFLGGLTKLIS